MVELSSKLIVLPPVLPLPCLYLVPSLFVAGQDSEVGEGRLLDTGEERAISQGVAALDMGL